MFVGSVTEVVTKAALMGVVAGGAVPNVSHTYPLARTQDHSRWRRESGLQGMVLVNE